MTMEPVIFTIQCCVWYRCHSKKWLIFHPELQRQKISCQLRTKILILLKMFEIIEQNYYRCEFRHRREYTGVKIRISYLHKQYR